MIPMRHCDVTYKAKMIKTRNTLKQTSPLKHEKNDKHSTKVKTALPTYQPLNREHINSRVIFTMHSPICYIIKIHTRQLMPYCYSWVISCYQDFLQCYQKRPTFSVTVLPRM